MKKNAYYIGNGPVFDGKVFIDNGTILISDGKIKKIQKNIPSKSSQIKFYDVEGRIIIPGLLNPHHHLYSSLAVGLAPRGDVPNFIKILENMWWKLDQALDEEIVYYSAINGLLNCIKYGVTTVFDHHSSTNFVSGSLAVIDKAFCDCGLKGVLCFETSDRHGERNAKKHIEENMSFISSRENSKKVSNTKAAFGLHANFTLNDRTLSMVREARPKHIPIHIHCGEDFSDLRICHSFGYKGPVQRLNYFGLLDQKSLLAHAVHISDDDVKIINEVQPVVISNPESNANNRVGKFNLHKIRKLVLGTDGMGSDMVSTLRSFYLLQNGSINFDFISQTFFEEKTKVLQKFFTETGVFREEMDADIAVLDYKPATPIVPGNFIPHLIYGAQNGKAFMTIANGEILFYDGKVMIMDEEKISGKILKTSKRLKERFNTL